ncbi:MAG: hypothetical protein ACREQA_21770 [Candidatus Binatia bacterium]
MHSRQLRAEVISASEITPQIVEHLYRLYESCYEGTDPVRFRADLEEKHWVILLRDVETQMVAGFSTQILMDVEVNQQPIRSLFSGDTVIYPNYWGSQELVRGWCRLAGQLKARCGDRPLYWFLISKGYRTYLYLPYFFHEFYPRYDRPTPLFEQRLIRALATAKYPKEFNPQTGLIEHPRSHDRLKWELDSTQKRQHNPHVAFFLQRNARYREGTELVCVAEISAENMRSIARREIEAAVQTSEPLLLYP